MVKNKNYQVLFFIPNIQGHMDLCYLSLLIAS